MWRALLLLHLFAAGGAVEEARIVFVADSEQGRNGNISKCCPPGKILASPGYCTKHETDDWSLHNSTIASFLNDDIIYNTVEIWNSFCHIWLYYVEEAPSAEAFHSSLVNGTREGRFFTKFYCADFLRIDEKPAREALAFWVTPGYGFIYEEIRPLQVVAAALLAAAVAVAACAHGRALVCHALCLLGANALQATWFFSHTAGDSCNFYAYAIYFFMISSSFWLNVITINIDREFRLLQEPRQAWDDWKLFGLFSLYAWGTAGALTVFSICMHAARRHMQLLGYTTPSFMETRTCHSESFYFGAPGERIHHNPKTGALFYFYVPSMIITAGNSVLLILTLHRMKHLSKCSIILDIPRYIKSSVLYVKLLLAAEVLELVLAATTWAVKPCQPLTNSGGVAHWSDLQDSAYRFDTIMTLVEVARAAVVLWLSVGRCGRCGRVGRWLRQLWTPCRSGAPSAASSAAAPFVSAADEVTSF